MIALLLGLISLAISIMFTTSFDKLANEVRDIRIKYLKIDSILRALKTNGSEKISAEMEEEEEDNELSYEENQPLESGLTQEMDGTNYYETTNFKENFHQGDVVEYFS